MSRYGSLNFTLGPAQCEEIKNAIEEFKRHKKQRLGEKFKMCCYADTFQSQLSYYLASSFDHIFMEPLGSIQLTGYNSTGVFFKNILDKIGIGINSKSTGDYKSVNSPLNSTKWRETEKENIKNILTSLNHELLTGINDRKINQMNLDPEANSILDYGTLSSVEAKKLNLIDNTKYIAELTRQVKNPCTMKRYLYARLNEKNFNPDKTVNVGIIHLSGGIQSGDKIFAAHKMVERILSAASNPLIDAYVVRIDSPGGEAGASDTIWGALKEAKRMTGKPFIASFGNVAASGGYLVGCSSDRIFASKSTITGSIGVAALRSYLTPKLLDNVGITTDEVQTTKSNDLNNIFKDIQGFHERRWNETTEFIYEIFLQRVKESRKDLTYERIKELAGGKVYTGTQAFENGLIDEVGGLWNSIDYCKKIIMEKKNIKDAQLKFTVYPRPKSVLENILEFNFGQLDMKNGLKFSLKDVLNTISSL